MKFTDRFFKFPVRVYDRFTVIQSFKQEENAESPLEGDWIKGTHSMPIEETYTMSYMDFYDSEKGVEGVRKKGFTETLVITRDESFICTLDRKEFEESLNDFMEEYMKILETEPQEQLK